MEVEVEVEVVDDSCKDIGVQTDFEDKPVVISSCSQTTVRVDLMCIDDFIQNPKGLQFFTGLDNYSIFVTVLSSLGPVAYQLNYLYDKKSSLTVPNQLLLVLVKLRTYRTNYELSFSFVFLNRKFILSLSLG